MLPGVNTVNVMNKTVVDVSVSNKVSFHVTSQDFSRTILLQKFLSDLLDNQDALDLLEGGDIVATSSFELTPCDNQLIEIRSLFLSDKPFYVSLKDLNLVCETSIEFTQTAKSLEIGFITNSQVQKQREFYVFAESEYDGHAYTNIDTIADETTVSSFDESILSLQKYNFFNKLCDRNDCFKDVPHQFHEEHTCTDGQTSDLDKLTAETSSRVSVNIEQTFKLPRIFSGTLITTNEPNSDTSTPLNFSSDLDMINTSNTLSHDNDTGNYLHSRSPVPCKYLPENSNLNVIGDLSEYLVCVGAQQTLKYYPKSHSTNNTPTFSNTVTFVIDGVEHMYESDSQWYNKRDAKRNVAYTAYKALGLPIPTVTTIPNGSQSSDSESVLWKNKLQEMFQLTECVELLPTYKTVPSPDGGFLSTVTVYFRNQESKSFTSNVFSSKKPAEKHAAELAFKALDSNF